MAVPVGVFVTRERDVAMPSRDLVAATVPLTSWVQAPAGGYFLSQEQPKVAANLVGTGGYSMRSTRHPPSSCGHK
jgi:hypothetical protein